MKSYGDIPEEHKKLAQALIEAESDLDDDASIADERKAQIYTCLAHDWYDINMEEEGHRLLLKANKVFPDYYRSKVKEHMAEDPMYDYLIKRISVELLKILASK